MNNAMSNEGRKEACKTYLEQTKLLVTLASAFLLAPAGLMAVKECAIDRHEIYLFIVAEIFFVVSVLAGYIVLGSVAGSQDRGAFDIFRLATRITSLVQFVSYLLGIGMFIWLVLRITRL